jgi:hypothetical protein
MPTFGSVLCGRNDGYGGHTQEKFIYVINSLIYACDEVYYIDWNSPNNVSLVDACKEHIVKFQKLHHIKISEKQVKELTNNDVDAQRCTEVLARNIGIRRLTTDFIYSTNTDDLTPHRRHFEIGRFHKDTFYIAARRDTTLSEVQTYAPYSGTITAINELEARMTARPHAGNAGCNDSDRWSIYACPGDFQLAHRDIWYKIKGYEEHMIYRGYTDSNVQCKAEVAGFNLIGINDLPVFHFAHDLDTGASGGGVGKWNDMEVYEGYVTKNKDTWGFSEIDFQEEII